MLKQNKVTGINNPHRLKNRRTSLNVNLSYVSNTSLLTEDEVNTSVSSICDGNTDISFEKTIVKRTELPIRRNLSIKKSTPGKQISNTRNSVNRNTIKIKPSYVRMVKISTNTPVTLRNGKIRGNQISEDSIVLSENTKRSSALEHIRFPLNGEIFSPHASIVMETSMDLTEVQEPAILNYEPEVSRLLNIPSNIEKRDNSSVVIQDTEDLRYSVEDRMKAAVVIPDSEQDSINTIRTSLNVNMSLDSRFSSIPNNDIYDRKKNREDNSHNDILVEKESAGIFSEPSSQSSYGNVPTNSVQVTEALIEYEHSSNDTNYPEIIERRTTVNLESQRQSHIFHKTALQNEIQTDNNKSINEDSPANDSSLTDSPSKINQDQHGFHLRTCNDGDENSDCNIPRTLAKNPIPRGKKKLLGLRRSEMIDLSPVSVSTVSKKRTVSKRRLNRRNKTAKKIDKKEDDSAKKSAADCSTNDDIEKIDPQSKKEKRVRKLKAKKIVMKKKPKVCLWKRMMENVNTMDDSCDDISSALGRTSLDDFAPKINNIRHGNRKIKPRIIIVATGLEIEQKLLVKSTVTILGSAKLDKIVTRNTTHVVSKGTRTVNLLRGIVRGCWLVSFEWISKSREAGEWVDPDKYEITGLSKAVQDNCKEKQLFGAAYVSELFLTCGLIHIKEETSTPAPVLKELVRIAGGRVASNPEEAQIIIGRGGFKEIWILDSIANGVIQPLEQYCKKKYLN